MPSKPAGVEFSDDDDDHHVAAGPSATQTRSESEYEYESSAASSDTEARIRDLENLDLLEETGLAGIDADLFKDDESDDEPEPDSQTGLELAQDVAQPTAPTIKITLSPTQQAVVNIIAEHGDKSKIATVGKVIDRFGRKKLEQESPSECQSQFYNWLAQIVRFSLFLGKEPGYGTVLPVVEVLAAMDLKARTKLRIDGPRIGDLETVVFDQAEGFLLPAGDYLAEVVDLPACLRIDGLSNDARLQAFASWYNPKPDQLKQIKKKLKKGAFSVPINESWSTDSVDSVHSDLLRNEDDSTASLHGSKVITQRSFNEQETKFLRAVCAKIDQISSRKLFNEAVRLLSDRSLAVSKSPLMLLLSAATAYHLGRVKGNFPSTVIPRILDNFEVIIKAGKPKGASGFLPLENKVTKILYNDLPERVDMPKKEVIAIWENGCAVEGGDESLMVQAYLVVRESKLYLDYDYIRVRNGYQRWFNDLQKVEAMGERTHGAEWSVNEVEDLLRIVLRIGRSNHEKLTAELKQGTLKPGTIGMGKKEFKKLGGRLPLKVGFQKMIKPEFVAAERIKDVLTHEEKNPRSEYPYSVRSAAAITATRTSKTELHVIALKTFSKAERELLLSAFYSRGVLERVLAGLNDKGVHTTEDARRVIDEVDAAEAAAKAKKKGKDKIKSKNKDESKSKGRSTGHPVDKSSTENQPSEEEKRQAEEEETKKRAAFDAWLLEAQARGAKIQAQGEPARLTQSKLPF